MRRLGPLALILLALTLAACSDDDTSTVSETTVAANQVPDTPPPAGEATTTTTTRNQASPPRHSQGDRTPAAHDDEPQQEASPQADSSGDGEQGGGEAGTTPPKPSFPVARRTQGQATPCGGYVLAGPGTPCPLATNVARYFRGSGAARFTIPTPATGGTTDVRCKGAHPTVCVADNGATVYLVP